MLCFAGIVTHLLDFLGKYQLGISDVWISNRIDKMLEDGVLEIIQDAPKGETNYRRILRKRMK